MLVVYWRGFRRPPHLVRRRDPRAAQLDRPDAAGLRAGLHHRVEVGVHHLAQHAAHAGGRAAPLSHAAVAAAARGGAVRDGRAVAAHLARGRRALERGRPATPSGARSSTRSPSCRSRGARRATTRCALTAVQIVAAAAAFVIALGSWRGCAFAPVPLGRAAGDRAARGAAVGAHPSRLVVEASTWRSSAPSDVCGQTWAMAQHVRDPRRDHLRAGAGVRHRDGHRLARLGRVAGRARRRQARRWSWWRSLVSELPRRRLNWAREALSIFSPTCTLPAALSGVGAARAHVGASVAERQVTSPADRW